MKRLSELEAEQRREVEAFLEAHPEFGEGAFERGQRDRGWVDGVTQTTQPVDPHTINAMEVFESAFPAAEAPTRMQEVQGELVARTLASMSEIHVRMLERRYLERMTLDAIAAEDGVTRQAVLKRLKAAKDSFIREFLNVTS